MSLLQALADRSENKCELCQNQNNLSAYTVPPKSGSETSHQIAACPTCQAQLDGTTPLDKDHLRCLAESMWSPVPAVQVVSYRLLGKMSEDPWAADLQGQIYMDEETQEWAAYADTAIVHKDSNGHVLSAGDSVVLIQDLNVKGAGFTAKRGTAVKRIRLDPDNANHIEGKVDGQHIVILTQYVKKM